VDEDLVRINIMKNHKWREPINMGSKISFNTILYDIDGFKFIVEDHLYGSVIRRVKVKSLRCRLGFHNWVSIEKPIRSVMFRENIVCKSVGVSGCSPVSIGKCKCSRCGKEMI